MSHRYIHGLSLKINCYLTSIKQLVESFTDYVGEIYAKGSTDRLGSEMTRKSRGNFKPLTTKALYCKHKKEQKRTAESNNSIGFVQLTHILQLFNIVDSFLNLTIHFLNLLDNS